MGTITAFPITTKKISELTTLTAGNVDQTADFLEITDTSATSSKKVSVLSLLNITGVPLGTSDTQNVTNKTLDNTNTITLKDTLFTLQDDGDTSKQAKFQLSGITTATTRTYVLPNASVTLASLTGTETLTNKTITSPAITGGTIDNSTVTVDSIAGHTSSTTGTVYGVSIASGKISGASITNTTIPYAALDTGASGATTTITPTKTGWVSTTKNVWQYQQIFKMVWLYFDVSGTSNSTFTNVTLPIAARSIGGTNQFEGSYGLASDNGSSGAGPRWNIDSAAPTICSFFTTYSGGAWTASGTKQIRGFIIYEAA